MLIPYLPSSRAAQFTATFSDRRHAHWLVEIAGAESLSNTIGALKKAIATPVNVSRDCVGQTLWQVAFHDRALRKDDVLVAAHYIVANPIRAGMVARVGDYPWWNAVWI